MIQEYIRGVKKCWERTSASQNGVWTSVRTRSCLICQLPRAGKLPVMPMLSLPVSAQSLQDGKPNHHPLECTTALMGRHPSVPAPPWFLRCITCTLISSRGN